MLTLSLINRYLIRHGMTTQLRGTELWVREDYTKDGIGGSIWNISFSIRIKMDT